MLAKGGAPFTAGTGGPAQKNPTSPHYIISLFFIPHWALFSTPTHLSFLFLSSSFLLSCFCLTAANILALQPKFLKKFVSDPKRWRIGTRVLLRDNYSLLSALRRALLREKKKYITQKELSSLCTRMENTMKCLLPFIKLQQNVSNFRKKIVNVYWMFAHVVNSILKWNQEKCS